jgi:hypothetical protein
VISGRRKGKGGRRKGRRKGRRGGRGRRGRRRRKKKIYLFGVLMLVMTCMINISLNHKMQLDAFWKRHCCMNNMIHNLYDMVFH